MQLEALHYDEKRRDEIFKIQSYIKGWTVFDLDLNWKF